MRFTSVMILCGLCFMLLTAQTADTSKVWLSFDNIGKSKAKAPVTVESVEGAVGKAVKITYPDNNKNQFVHHYFPKDAERDTFDGISFRIKGDGTDGFGCLQFIDESDYALRYGYLFPLKNTEWHQITIPFKDIFPETHKGAILDPKNGGYGPSNFGTLWIGKWHYHRQFPAQSFAIDDLRLVKGIEVKEYPDTDPGIPRVLAKLKAKEPVTIVTVGDSLTDARHWANKGTAWPGQLEKKLKAEYGYDAITVINSGIGGNQLNHGAVLLPRNVLPHKPDLVTICYGYNDWSSGMRGPQFRIIYDAVIERLHRLTEGKAEVLLMTTCPALERWDTMAEMAVSVREAAKANNTGLADTEKAFKAIAEADRASYYVRDKTHTSAKGDALLADTVFNAILNGAIPE